MSVMAMFQQLTFIRGVRRVSPCAKPGQPEDRYGGGFVGEIADTNPAGDGD